MAIKFTDEISPRSMSPFVKSPVVSKAEGIDVANNLSSFANFTGLAADIYKDVQENKALSSLTEDIQTQIDLYESASPSKIQESGVKLAQSELELAKLPMIEGASADEVNDKVNSILNEIDVQTDFLTKARDQDRISGFELDNRIKGVIKQKLVDFPYLKRPILSHASTILDLSNISNRIKVDDKIDTERAKAVNEDIKFIRQEAKDLSIDLTPYTDANGNVDWLGSVQNHIMTKRRINDLDNQITSSASRGESVDKIQFRALKKSGILDQITINREVDDINQIISFFGPKVNEQGQPISLSAQDIAIAKTNADQYITNAVLNARRSFNKYAELDQTYVNTLLTNYENSLKATYKNISELTDGTKIKGILENKKSSLDAYWSAQTRMQFGNTPEVMGILEKTVNVGTIAGVTLTQDDYAKLIKNVVEMNSAAQKDALEYISTLNDPSASNPNKSIAEDILNISISNLEKDQSAFAVAKRTIKGLKDSMDNPEVDDGEKYKLYTGMLKGLSATNVTAMDVSSLDDPSKTLLLDTINVVNPVILSNLKLELETNPNIKLQKDGRGLLIAVGANPAFVNTFITPLNNAIKVRSKLFGYDTFTQESDNIINLETFDKAPNVIDQTLIERGNQPIDQNMTRTDGTRKSSQGFLGPQTSTKGNTMTEYEVDGIPMLVPGLTKEELDILKTEPAPKDIPESIMKKAIDHADKRRKEGKSPFYQDGENQGDATIPGQFTLDFIKNELGPKESPQGHRDAKNKLIKSPSGALGQYQIMPETAKDPGFGLPSIDLEEASVLKQAEWAQDYLNALLDKYNGDREKALAAYNYGPANLDNLISKYGSKWKENLPRETLNYIKDLM